MFLILVYYKDDLYAYKCPVCKDLFPRYQTCYPDLIVKISNDLEKLEVPIKELSLNYKEV